MVERVQASARDEVVEVLVKAFWDYPVMRFVLRDSDSDYPRHVQALIGLFADRRFARDWPVLATSDTGDLTAVALINDPEYTPLPDSHAGIEQELRALIGQPAWQRMVDFESTPGLDPAYPHHYVGMLGVRPESQGKGLARMILDEVVRMSSADPRSRAVCLSTESSANIPFYEHLGFEITGEADVGDLHTWALMKRTA